MKIKVLSLSIALLVSVLLFGQVKTQPIQKQTVKFTAKPQLLDRSKRPVPGPAPLIKIGEAKSFVLPNGLKVFVVEDHKIPTVSFSLVLDYDPFIEGEFGGYASIAGQLMRTGTATRTKDQIDEEVDFIGASLGTSANGISGSCLTKHTGKLLTVMSDILLNASFKQEELEKIRKQTLSGLEAQKNDPKAIAANVSGKLVYGNHPYGEILTQESVRKITLEKCNEFYKTYYKPNIGYLAIVGDVTLDQAKALTSKYFGKWQKGEVPKATFPTPAAPSNRIVAIADRPNAVQTTLNITYPFELKPGSPDEIKLKVANNILGGSGFRLFNNLREKHGWTYGAYSSVKSDKLVGRFSASAEVRNPVTDSSVTQFLHEMERIRTEPVSADELAMAKNTMIGNFSRSLETPATIASFAINTALYNLPKDYYATFITKLSAVTVADVQAMAQKYIKPENAYVLAVGKAEEIAPKLQQFTNGGAIKYYDIAGNEYDPSKKGKAVPAGATAQNVIDQYLKAIGGSAELKKITDLTIKMSMKMQGMEISINQYQKLPDKFMQTTQVGTMVVATQVYKDGKGAVTAQGQTKGVEGKDLADMKENVYPFKELVLNSLGIKAELKGIEALDGKDCYVIKTESEAGTETIYYEVSSGLKLKSISDKSTIYYSDYKPVGAILYPFSLKQEIAGMPSAFDIKVVSVEANTNPADDMFK